MKIRYLRSSDRILYDCGVGRSRADVRSVFLSPTTGPKTHSKTMREKVFNANIRRARNIVEHSYGRVKNKWGYLHLYRGEHARVFKTFKSCCTLSNIDQAYDNPLRHTPCKKARCAYCENF